MKERREAITEGRKEGSYGKKETMEGRKEGRTFSFRGGRGKGSYWSILMKEGRQETIEGRKEGRNFWKEGSSGRKEGPFLFVGEEGKAPIGQYY